MLPAAHRLADPASFRRVSRQGRRAGTRALVTHLLVEPDLSPARAGFVVSRAVGSAVDRNRVKRRLRHAVAAQLDALPQGTRLVVRAQPAAARASYAELAADLDRCLRRSLDTGAPTEVSP